MLVYHMEPLRQGEGQPDLAAIFQLCRPISSDRWAARGQDARALAHPPLAGVGGLARYWMRVRFLNKVVYDVQANPLLRWADAQLRWVTGGTSLGHLLTNGYGYDWSEDVQADAEDAARASLVAEVGTPLPGPHRLLP